jgi:hypothetical protein
MRKCLMIYYDFFYFCCLERISSPWRLFFFLLAVRVVQRYDQMPEVCSEIPFFLLPGTHNLFLCVFQIELIRDRESGDRRSTNSVFRSV